MAAEDAQAAAAAAVAEPPALATTSCAPTPTAAATAGPSFVPRALKKRPAASQPASTFLSARPSKSNSNSNAPTPPPPAPPPPAPPPVSSAETQRLESLLVAIETSFSDYGLSYYRSSGLLDRFKRGAAWIHVSQVLALPPVRALTGVLADLQKALRVRPSGLVKVRAPGFG
ncbi:hypothetical protein JCM21900_000699, partial [Sporobolomyces salmonicolor]